MLHIDEEVEMAEEVCTEDGLLDIGKAEYPAVGAAKTKIESERPGTVCRNGSVVDCLQAQAVIWVSAFCVRGREYTYFCTGVHEKTAQSVMYKMHLSPLATGLIVSLAAGWAALGTETLMVPAAGVI